MPSASSRPLGGIVFGHFGDKYGRKKLLQLAIILVGVATFLMGACRRSPRSATGRPRCSCCCASPRASPSAASGAAACCWSPSTPQQDRGFWASFPQAAVPIGNLVATVVLLILSRTLSQEAFLAWGWRVGFGCRS
jgi:MFS family permease